MSLLFRSATAHLLQALRVQAEMIIRELREFVGIVQFYLFGSLIRQVLAVLEQLRPESTMPQNIRILLASKSFRSVLNAEFFNVLIVASRGNYNNGSQPDPFLLSEPAFRPEVVSVGAMNPCGHRKDASSVCEGLSSWGSRYDVSDNGGVQPSGALDLVAPGVNIYSANKGGGY